MVFINELTSGTELRLIYHEKTSVSRGNYPKTVCLQSIYSASRRIALILYIEKI